METVILSLGCGHCAAKKTTEQKLLGKDKQLVAGRQSPSPLLLNRKHTDGQREQSLNERSNDMQHSKDTPLLDRKSLELIKVCAVCECFPSSEEHTSELQSRPHIS